MVTQPGLKALCEAEHPERYVLFGDGSSCIYGSNVVYTVWKSLSYPHFPQTGLALKAVLVLLNSLPFGELRTGTWALSVHQVPSSSEW